ncbi:uncharacterized protein LTHEOB_11728 [Lasiodiplodia theobromae]|uniref:uncharacterized protein n=1 Tax=Lasiodiplodia theobromae TaxID=45133 RepID=UPI0015C38DF0|nr:uncharacterized protein LTHEOB_11728 [Lasiodiplodia theobromae]KAF4537019.1 hypothetical protein LTHEOB_11728 [Lasiodiplodia theobromae]
MAHHEQRDTPVGDSVLAIVGAFTSGLDVFKRLRERRRRRRSSKKSHRATPAQLEPSGDELQLSNSLRQNPLDIQRHYESNYAAVGEKFAQGDAIAHASLTEVLLKLNSGLVAIIGAFLSPGKNDHHPDYKSLTSLSDTSRAEAIDALGQLYQRLSQSQLVLDRVRHKCPSCGSHHHHDCGSSANPRQRGGCANAKRIPGAKPKPRRSQTELVIVRRPRNSAKYPPMKKPSSAALASRSQRQSNNASSGSSASTPVTTSFPPVDLPPRPQLPRSQSTSTSRSDPPPSYSKATAMSQPPSREMSLTRKPVKAPVAAAPTTAKPQVKAPAAAAPVTAKAQVPAITAPPLQRPETWPHGPRPLREANALPIIPPQEPPQPQRQQEHQNPLAHLQPAPLVIPQRPPRQQATAAAAAAPPLFQPARPPKFPVSTAALAELPGSSIAPAPPPPPPPNPNVLHRRQPPAPPPKKQHLQAPQRPRPLNSEQQQPRTSTSGSVNLHLHPSAQLSAGSTSSRSRATTTAAAAAALTTTPSTYSFSSDSTKLGEIPMRKWTVPWDYAAMERANAEAAALRGNLPAMEVGQIPGDGGRRRGGLLRFLRRGE